MSHFEFVVISFALIYSHSAVRLYSALPHLNQKDSRYPPMIFYITFILFATAITFWSLWSYRDFQWDFLAYIRHLATPACLFYLAVTLVPDNPAKIESWEKHFFEIRTRFFGGLVVFALILSVNVTLTAEMPLYHPMRVVHLCVALLGVAGLATASQGAHKKIMWFAIFSLLTAIVVNMAPSSLN